MKNAYKHNKSHALEPRTVLTSHWLAVDHIRNSLAGIAKR
jgi:hypothetical protein